MKKEISIQLKGKTDTIPVAELVSLANRFESKIYFEKDTKRINAKSIMGMMSLVLGTDTIVTVDAQGPDENKAIEALEEFFKHDMA